jgi:hypothetical protein
VAAPPVDPDTDLTALPAPLVDADIDLSTTLYFPILIRRLFQSEFHLKATDSEWRAGFTLWLQSWEQHPSGSLPNDDRQLRRLAGLAGGARWKWYRVRDMALHGWVLCADGRLYHKMIAELVELTLGWTGRVTRAEQKRSKSGANREQTKREPHLKSMPIFDKEKRRESPPISPPGGGDLLSWNGMRPIGREPAPIDPRRIGHALPCHCENCRRWVAAQAKTGTC